MTSYSFGDVVLTYFPFTDLLGGKKRPAAVISPPRYQEIKSDVMIIAITSQPNPKLELGEFALEGWAQAGLLAPSAVKAQITTVLASRLDRKIGALNAPDQQALRRLLATLLGPDNA